MKAQKIIQAFEKSKYNLALAESLTGGLLCSELVSVAGASKVILGSIVAYQTKLKSSYFGVSTELLNKRGAVDPEVALNMALGVRSRFALQMMISTDLVIGVSTTGVAGPEEQDGKPVGLVYIAISGPKGDQVWEETFSGDRNAIRLETVNRALGRIWEYLGS